jgi:hypothetical protein
VGNIFQAVLGFLGVVEMTGLQHQIQLLELKEEKLTSRFDLLQDNWDALEKDLHNGIVEASKLYFEMNPEVDEISLKLVDGEVILKVFPEKEVSEEEENHDLESLEIALEQFYSLLLTNIEITLTPDTTLEEVEKMFN